MTGIVQEFVMNGKRLRLTIEHDQIELYNMTDGKHVLELRGDTQRMTVYSVNGIVKTVRYGSQIETIQL